MQYLYYVDFDWDTVTLIKIQTFFILEDTVKPV